MTSIRLPHMRMMQNAKGFIFSHPVLLHVWAYFDGDDGVRPPRRDNVTWVNISHVQPWAAAYIEANFSSKDASETSRTQQAYRTGRFQPCVVPVPKSDDSKPFQRTAICNALQKLRAHHDHGPSCACAGLLTATQGSRSWYTFDSSTFNTVSGRDRR